MISSTTFHQTGRRFLASVLVSAVLASVGLVLGGRAPAYARAAPEGFADLAEKVLPISRKR